MINIIKKAIKSFECLKNSSRPVKELFISTAILQFAVSAVSIFEPIYLYVQGFSVRQIIIFFLSVYVIYFFIMPFGAKVTRAKGYEFGIISSTPFLIFYYLSLFAIPYGRIFIFTAIISFALQKMLYWPGYNADFARFTRKEEMGRSIGGMAALNYAVWIFGPFFGGLIISLFSFKILFLIVSLMIMLSNIPLMTTREIFEPRPFSYFNAYRRLFRKVNRRKFFAYLGFGEEFISIFIWPVFIYLIIGDYFSIGYIVAASVFLTLLVILYIGKAADEAGERSILKTGVVFLFFSWMARMAARSGLGVFLANSGYQVSSSILGIPLLAITYRQAKDYSVTKSAIFFEMSLVLGKILAGVILLVIFSLVGLQWPIVFIIAASFSLLYALL